MENNSSSSSLSWSSVEIIVVSDIGDGPKASEPIVVSGALGSYSQFNDKEELVLYKLASIWKKNFEKFKNVSDYATEKVTPNMGLAVLVLTIQSIYQMASSMSVTTSEGKVVQQVKGVVVVLLLYGLLMPKCAGGRIALVAGFLLASLAAVVLSFKN